MANKGLQNLRMILEDRIALQHSYKHVFNTPEGERVIRHLMKQCGILNPKITTDTNTLLIQQGQRHIVLSILRILGKDVNQLTEQIKESLQNEE